MRKTQNVKSNFVTMFINGNVSLTDFYRRNTTTLQFTKDEEYQFISRAQHGDARAFNTLFAEMAPMVNDLLSRKFYDHRDDEDVIETAFIGVTKAIQKFDLSSGYALSTLAYRCMENSVRTYLSSVYKHWTMDSIDGNAWWSENPKSDVDDEDSPIMREMLGDPESTYFEDEVADCGCMADFLECISHLSPRTQEIALLAFGFKGGERLTQAEIGARIGLTGNRVGQILSQEILPLLSQHYNQHTF